MESSLQGLVYYSGGVSGIARAQGPDKRSNQFHLPSFSNDNKTTMILEQALRSILAVSFLPVIYDETRYSAVFQLKLPYVPHGKSQPNFI